MTSIQKINNLKNSF